VDYKKFVSPVPVAQGFEEVENGALEDTA